MARSSQLRLCRRPPSGIRPSRCYPISENSSKHPSPPLLHLLLRGYFSACLDFGLDLSSALEGPGGQNRNFAPAVNVFNWSSDNPLKSSILISLYFLVFTSVFRAFGRSNMLLL